MKAKSIVILNREHDVLTLLESFLSVTKHTIYTLSNPNEAIAILKNSEIPVHFFIIGSNLGKSSCFTIIKTVKKIRKNVKILLTVVSEDEVFFRRAYKLGIDGIITLPCSMKEFFTYMETLK